MSVFSPQHLTLLVLFTSLICPAGITLGLVGLARSPRRSAGVAIALGIWGSLYIPTVLLPFDRVATAYSAKDILPVAVEMEELFPVADQWIVQGPKWDTTVYFGGRYELTMQADIRIDYGNNRIIRVIGEPLFVLWEIEKVEILPDGRTYATYRTQNERRFGLKEWESIRQSKGDLSSIGIKMKTDEVENWHEYVRQWRRGRSGVSVSLLK